jgi:hypothetical protein
MTTQAHDAGKLRYVIHNGTATGAALPDREKWIPVHNQVYRNWRNFWQMIYRDAGSPESFLKDDFRRLDAIGSLFLEEQYVGSLCSSLFDLELESDLEHRYFHFYTPEFLLRLRQKNARQLMSVEFLMVLPEWRRLIPGVSLSDVLIGLSTRIFEQTGRDALIATPRMDIKVNERGYQFGFERIDGPLTRRNFQVELVAAFRSNIRRTPNTIVAEIIDSLWSRRTDLTGLTYSDSLPQNLNIAA